MNQEKIKDYLYDCRWCNFKEDIKQGRVQNVSFEKMPYDDGNKLFIIGTATIEGKEPKYFSMPLAKKQGMPEDGNAVVMDGNIYVDALREPDFWRTLMAFLNEHNGKIVFDNGWSLEHLTIGSQVPVMECLEDDSRALGVEQSNTTLNVGQGKLAFKLERMLEFSHELNSEIEMNEKLMREHCTVMPKSFGGLIWRRPDGQQASSGIMQEFVTNKGDMWNYLQRYLSERLHTEYMMQRDLTPEGNPEFMKMIQNLAAKTEEMGECFARADENPNFTPQKVNESFIRIYEKQLQVLAHRVKKNIEMHLDDLPFETRKNAENLLEHWDKDVKDFVEMRLAQVRQAEDKGTLNRVHGDFHLGQVMVTPENDLRFIDFAGEPDLPMEQRKQKHLSVRDVAGMYRSIKGYLGAVAVENFAAQTEDVLTASARKMWAEKAIKPLIDAAAQTFLGHKTMSDPWLSLEVLRKNLYEVNYEVGNRPTMAYVPINGLKDLILGTHERVVANENFQVWHDEAYAI